jgi:hypothetical protein
MADKVYTKEGTKKVYEVANRLANRYLRKINGADAMMAKLAQFALDLQGEKANLPEINAVCKQILRLANEEQISEITDKVVKANNGWLTSKEGAEGRFSEPYNQTTVPTQVTDWLKAKPALNVPFKVLKAWIDAGYTLLNGDLNHPWGLCDCGKEKILPWKNAKGVWRPSKLGRICYQEGKKQLEDEVLNFEKPKKTGGKKPVHKPQEKKSPEQVKAEKAARRQQKEQNRLAAEAELQNLHPGSAHRDGATKKARDAAKAERAQGGHPEGKNSKKGKAVTGEGAPKASKKK